MVTKTYTYLGKTKKGGYHIIKGQYDVGAADTYSQLAKMQLDFPMISDIKEVLAVFPNLVANTSNPVAISNALAAAVAADGAARVDETVAANQATVNDMTLLPAGPVVDDAYYIGGPVKFGKARFVISTPGAGVWTITWEYSTLGGVYVAIPGVVDGTVGFTQSGTVSFDPKQIPAWATDTQAALTAYFIRGRVSAYTSIATQPLGAQCFIENLGNVVLLVPLAGAAGAGLIMAEKTDSEAYGQIFSWGAIVAGS